MEDAEFVESSGQDEQAKVAPQPAEEKLSSDKPFSNEVLGKALASAIRDTIASGKPNQLTLSTGLGVDVVILVGRVVQEGK